jgi:hypothetical protein
MALILNITRWPALLVFAAAGVSAIAFAFLTVNLFTQAMANIAFIERHGLLALSEGALLQSAQLAGWGLLALAALLAFRACEVELVFRYFLWAGRVDDGPEGRRALRFRRAKHERRR